jgi:polygalacturonase
MFDNMTLPTFPLNTDGIDIWGRNFTIKRVKINNWDDAIVAKPSNKGLAISKCTENIYVEDIYTKFGIGMTVGSVAPNEDHACIQNVHFKNVRMDYPIKAIYVKSNPGNHGDGIIKNITY